MRTPTFYDSAAWRNLARHEYASLVRLGESHQEAALRLVREAKRAGIRYEQADVVRALNELMLDWIREQVEGGQAWTYKEEDAGRKAYEEESDF